MGEFHHFRPCGGIIYLHFYLTYHQQTILLSIQRRLLPMRKKRKKAILKNPKQTESSGSHVNRKYKDTLFRMIFRDKKNLLSLYNALNHSSYTNIDDMEITTLEDVIYVGMKNDVSFLFSSVMNLYEHQSTFNPNMPIRGLFYLAKIYQNYIKKEDLNIYGTERITVNNF